MSGLTNKIKSDNQVKSKQRVTDHGEVFTSEREVNLMLDLVKNETERIDSRFLEPACGTGNFLVEILKRKLTVVGSRYAKNQLEYERYVVVAISSLYGIDIMPDNVVECRTRLFNIFNKQYSSLFKIHCKKKCREAIHFILNRNILLGDALSLKIPSENNKPILFSEWSLVKGSLIKRRDFSFDTLSVPKEKGLFDTQLFSDIGTQGFIPMPVKEFPLIHFLNIGEDDTNEL